MELGWQIPCIPRIYTCFESLGAKKHKTYGTKRFLDQTLIHQKNIILTPSVW